MNKLPTISKIRFTNVVYEGGNKRYTDEIFQFHGQNSAIVLENGGGKTVFIQAALQSVLPHSSLANRKIKDTFTFDDGPAHIAIEWIKNDRPRIYALTAVTIFPYQNTIDSYRYVYEYGPNDENAIENLPFTQVSTNHKKRIASHAEIKEYYNAMTQKSSNAKTFSTISSYTDYIEKNFQLISDEWKSINTINSAEGDVEKFFEACPTEKALYEKLLIPTVEQSIAEFNKNRFVDIFEKQRDHFRLYKQLNEQLKEYEVIQQQISSYVQEVSTLYQTEQAYEADKQLSKKYFTLLKKQLSIVQERATLINEKQNQLQQRFIEHEHKKKSYQIAVIQEKLEKIVDRYRLAVEKETALLSKIEEEQLYLYNVRYANEKNLLTEAKQNLEIYVEQLKKIDEEYSTEDLLKQLDLVKAQIHGNMIELNDRFNQQLGKILLQEKQYEELHLTQQQDLEKMSKQDRKLELLINEITTKINMHQQQAENIAKDLFENDLQKQQPLVELRSYWTEQAQSLDNQNVKLLKEERELKQLIHDNEQLNKEYADKLLKLKGDETTILGAINGIKEKENALRNELMKVVPKINDTTNLYAKEASILQQLTQLHEKKHRQFGDKLNEERLAFRHVDDYGELSSFFADSYIAKKLPIWKQQFSLLETAIEYAENEEQLKSYSSLLAITLITTDNEKEKLEQKILNASKHLTYPIQVWSLSEVTAISKGEKKPIQLLEPELWLELNEVTTFQDWQQKALQMAQAVKQQREIIDTERMQIASILEQLQQFYKQFPFSYYQQLQDDLKVIQAQEYETSMNQQESVKLIDEAQQSLLKIGKKIAYNKDMQKYYHDKVKLVLDYEREIKLLEQNRLQKNVEEKKKETIVTQLNNLREKVDETNNLLVETKNRKQDMQLEYTRVSAERTLYKKVQTIHPVFSENSYEVLERQYNDFEAKINGFTTTRKSIEQLLQQQEEQIKQCENRMMELEAEFPNLNKEMPLPIDYKQILYKKPSEIKHLEDEHDRLIKNVNDINTEKIKQEAILEEKLNEVDSIITYTIPLENVHFQLKEELASLKRQQSQLTNEKESNDKQEYEINSFIQEMRISDAKHSFLAPRIELAILPIDDEHDFSYRPKLYIEKALKEMDEKIQQVERKRKLVAESKAKFIKYCELHVSEVRLRNTIIDGIKSKESYEDIVNHQKSMEKTIHMSRQYAEENIKKHDEDLVTFIQHIHSHLRKVVEELKQIPRKTKIYVDDEDVYIYRFTIPEWTDEEGIAQIRARIDWIINQLEQMEKRDIADQDGEQKMRKQLEEWLSTIQLLRYITQNKEWRISCKKVMNDNRISKGYETWSRSNNWSGGEKWSKNMALFLGVLNYVAEKRQYISPKKKSRTFILDNPFGKASSDHVLSPVFFIAEQLGFQIIALTAHVEGKFLHDYFPGVYSCRLREASGTEKLIMETKKTIHHALFTDKDEAAGEVIKSEQLEMFSEL